MARKDRRRGRGRRFLLGTLIVLALLWCGYWYAANTIATAAVGRLIAAASARGHTAACVTQGLSGFPLSLDFNCSGAKFADPQVSAGLTQVAVTAPLYRPGHVVAELSAPLALNAPDLGLAVTASWNHAAATADAGLGGLTGATGSVSGLALEQSGASPRLPFRRIAAVEAEFAAAPSADEEYRLTATARDIAIESASGQKLPVLAGAIDLSAEQFGGSLGLDPKRTLMAWLAKGGKLDVTRLTLFIGTASISASGPLALSNAGLLSGSLNVRLVGLESLPELAEEMKPGSRDRVTRVVAAITAFTKPVKTEEGEAREMTFTIRQGVVLAGLVPVATIPAIRF